MAASWSLAATIIPFLLCIFVGQSQDMTEQAVLPTAKNGGYQYVATIYPIPSTTTWAGECFGKNTGWVTFNIDHSSSWIVITVENPVKTFCKDYYQFKVEDRIIGTDSIYSQYTGHETYIDTMDREFRKQVYKGVLVYIWRSNELNVKTNNGTVLKQVVEDA